MTPRPQMTFSRPGNPDLCSSSRPAGVDTCRDSGFRGRLALAEVLHFSDAMKEAMLARSPRRKLKEVALNDGFVPLSTIALRAVVEGKTTWEEVNRVITH